MSIAIANPSSTPPSWWDTTWEADTEPEWRFGAPMPGSLMPCGCHLRRPDYEAVLCGVHLAELNERPPACPRHGATCRTDGTCMVRGCPHGGTDG